jgi:hypothetical protein
LRTGLGLLLAGAVLHAPLHAQRDTIPRARRDSIARRDSLRRDSLARATRGDTIKKKRDTTLTVRVPRAADSLLADTLAKRDSLHPPKPDTIKAATAHSELPPDVGLGRKLYFPRDSLFATGAVTVADLLARVPGLTIFSAGWIAAPAAAAYMGDFQRVRVFYDGFEFRPLDPRTHGVLDLTTINLWSADDVLVEVMADEVRVYIRSWRVRGTTPVTRTDVSTGDQQTNLYRGFFGKRYNGGEALQFAAQQYGTTPPSLFGTSSDQLALIGRIGWANPALSIDAYAMRTGRHTGIITSDVLFDRPLVDTIPAHDWQRTDAYFRIAHGDPDTSTVWLQTLAVGSNFRYTGIRTFVGTPATHTDSLRAFASLDTNVFRAQYIASLGFVFGPLRLSGSERVWGRNGVGGTMLSSPSGRASLTLGRLAISGFAEARGIDSVARGDVTASFVPLSFIGVQGSVGRLADYRPDYLFAANYMRGEAGLRIFGLWLLGGILRRDSVPLTPPALFNTRFSPVRDTTVILPLHEPPVTGYTAAIRGRIWRFIQTDVSAVQWNDTTGFFRPRYQTRSELFVRTNLRERFPTNDFGLMFSLIHEYRSGTRFFLRNPTSSTAGDTLAVPGYRTIGLLLEIRILSATLSWQFRNMLGERYSTVPFFLMPRQTNFYGVRWEFFN